MIGLLHLKKSYEKYPAIHDNGYTPLGDVGLRKLLSRYSWTHNTDHRDVWNNLSLHIFMKIGILSNEQYTNSQKDSIGSSRIRCKWVINHWPDAEEFKIGVHYDAVIFQKAYFSEYMKVYDGIKILDLCDPDWMAGKAVIECAELCDAITVSSQGLYDYLSKILSKPVYLIPDRVDLDEVLPQKKHEGIAKSVVWFGYHHNQQVLDPVLPCLKRLGLDLTVISNLPYYPVGAVADVDKTWITAHLRNIKYDPLTINEEIIMGGEMVLNNRPEIGKFKYKSENKTIIAWSLNMPVAKDADDVERFMKAEGRITEMSLRSGEVREQWQVEKSVQEYKNVISDIQRERSAASMPPVSATQEGLPLAQ